MEGGRGRVVRGIDGEKRDGGDRKHPPRSHRQPFRRNRVRDYGKAEFLNPGGSIKDRVALQIVQEGLSTGELRPGGTVFEGTAGSTGVSLSLVAAAMGCKCHVVLSDDAAKEKAELLPPSPRTRSPRSSTAPGSGG